VNLRRENTCNADCRCTGVLQCSRLSVALRADVAGLGQQRSKPRRPSAQGHPQADCIQQWDAVPSPTNELWTCSSLTSDAWNQHRGMHTDPLGSKQSPACCKTLAIRTLSVTLSSSLTQSQHKCSVARKSNRYETACPACGVREPGACVKVCSVRVSGLQGFMSVYVRSVVVRGPASLSYVASVRLSASFQQPAGVSSVRLLPATQQFRSQTPGSCPNAPGRSCKLRSTLGRIWSFWQAKLVAGLDAMGRRTYRGIDK
jgi:hypothetical protein